MDELKQKIRHVPDFPKPGILFYDITTLLRDPAGFRGALDAMAAPMAGERIDLVAGVESRGFIFAAALAERFGAGFVPIRKPGKLPARSVSVEYTLEYGSGVLQMHEDAVTPGQRVLIVDDLLATGGTARAACDLVTRCGGDVVAAGFLVELTFLNGRDRLRDQRVYSVLAYAD
ncbi:MAG: adenine phosphoribosyltransferase [Acidobacteria bacterium]|jgi:adenine phosphoribosyltransferase|nr:adenine phosphoribosyltransferase [Acidobacteriota bacterium]